MKNIAEIVANAGLLWQHKREFVAFCEWLRANDVKSVLEIGTGFGGSAYVFGEITDHGKIVTVDFDKLVSAEKKRAQSNPNFVQVHGSSRSDAVEHIVEGYAPFDLVFFDTEHPYEECEENFRRYAKMATRFIAQHDINADEEHWPDMGIPRFWRETVEQHVGVSLNFIDPDPDPRFPRWGGIGVVCI